MSAPMDEYRQWLESEAERLRRQLDDGVLASMEEYYTGLFRGLRWALSWLDDNVGTEASL